MSANVGPYIANIGLEQRRRELRAERFIPLAESFNNLSQTMFALAEYHQQRAEAKANSLTNMMKFFDPDAIPQWLTNQWGDAVQGASGVQLPKDTQGNTVFKPSPDAFLSPEDKQMKKNLTPEQYKSYLLQKAGIGMTEKEKEALDEQKRFHNIEQSHWQQEDAIRAAAANRVGKGKDDSSPWTIGEDGHIRVAQPGERSLTHKDITSWTALNRLALTQERNDWLKKKDKLALKDRESELKTMEGLASVASKIPKGPAREQASRDIWENHWRPLMISSGKPDPGPFKDSNSLFSAVMSTINSYRSPETPSPTFKSVKPTGNVVQAPQMSPEEEAASYEKGQP